MNYIGKEITSKCSKRLFPALAEISIGELKVVGFNISSESYTFNVITVGTAVSVIKSLALINVYTCAIYDDSHHYFLISSDLMDIVVNPSWYADVAYEWSKSGVIVSNDT